MVMGLLEPDLLVIALELLVEQELALCVPLLSADTTPDLLGSPAE